MTSGMAAESFTFSHLNCKPSGPYTASLGASIYSAVDALGDILYEEVGTEPQQMEVVMSQHNGSKGAGVSIL